MIEVMKRLGCRHCFGWSERRQGHVCYRCHLFVAEPAAAPPQGGLLRHRGSNPPGQAAPEPGPGARRGWPDLDNYIT